jgi:hypothetical protein
MTTTHVYRLGLAALAMALTGCGNLTAGGYEEVEVYASGDADESPSASPTTPPSSAPAGAPGPLPAGAGLIGGTLEATLNLSLVSESGSAIVLSPSSAIVVEVDLDGSDTPLVAERLIPTERYTALRVRFTSVTADVLTGLVIGGIPYIGPVAVDLGTGAFELDVPVSFEVERGDDVRLLLDFNADEWLQTLDVLSQTVTSTDFGTRLEVSIR